MPGKWDTSTKRLLGENPEHFIRWLFPEAQVKGPVTLRPVNLNTREMEADSFCQTVLNGVDCLINLEFQSYADSEMDKRLWKYNALATIAYDLPTSSVVLYLRKCEVPEKEEFAWEFPTGLVVHRFHYRIIKLWEIPVEDLKQTGLLGIFPLLVLSQGGKRREVIEEVITTLQSSTENKGKELLSLTYIIASLIFENATEKQWLKRRFHMLRDALRDTWAYQEIMQEGRAEERLQRLQDQRQLLMTLVEARFPEMADLAQQQVNAVEDPEVLQDVVLRLIAAQSEEQVEQVLLSMGHQAGRKTSQRNRRKKHSS